MINVIVANTPKPSGIIVKSNVHHIKTANSVKNFSFVCLSFAFNTYNETSAPDIINPSIITK